MSYSKCIVCEIEKGSGPNFICGRDRGKIRALLRSVQVLHADFIQLNNVKLGTDVTGTEYVVAIDGTGVAGWQRPFGINGYVKCMICDGLAQHNPVCEDCRGAILAFRTVADQAQALDKIVQFFTNSKLQAFFQLAGERAFGEWMARELEGLYGNNDED